MQQSEKQKSWKKDHYLNNKEFYRQRLVESRKRSKEWMWEYKLKHPCERCGHNHPAALDFHHLIPSEKSHDINQMVNYCFNKDKILAEIAKCQVLCASCHRIVEWEIRQK